ncbi:unnamed protein product [Miscanthus lutarioriparius]|uniref:RING-type domain-containing protein n=1 Tax=Miscanthus lutarioriparius TaxID=422564 RepID=A0A811SII8_9POAL|nr:unnamed protein product [Miscanthus lutarioriparius]
MAPAWERAKRALATRFCMRFAARRVVVDDAPSGLVDMDAPFPVATEAEQQQQQQQPDEREVSLAAVSPEPASSEQLASRSSGSRSSAEEIALTVLPLVLNAVICEATFPDSKALSIYFGSYLRHEVRPSGQALFTAECSHKFHFSCISSNVQHGNKICPICRAVWKELPFQGPQLAASAAHGSGRLNPSIWPHMSMLSVNPLEDELPVFVIPEPAVFNDDEQIYLQPETAVGGGDYEIPPLLEITTYTAFPAIQESVAQEQFAILIHLKAPHVPAWSAHPSTTGSGDCARRQREHVWLQACALKRAMRFVIENLDPSDRLSVVAFLLDGLQAVPAPEDDRRLQQQSLQAVDSSSPMVAPTSPRDCGKLPGWWRTGKPGTRCAASSCSLTAWTPTTSRRWGGSAPDYAPLVPRSILPGSEHHDAFKQCIGGLLSVVAQETRLSVECADQGVLLTSIKSGSYASGVDGDGRGGFVHVGRLYADEERDFLVTVRVPPSRVSTALIRPICTYRDAVTAEMVRVGGDPVMLLRPEFPVSAGMSLQVEREWHRVHATEDMAAAQAAAEEGHYTRAASILEARRLLLESCALLSWDQQTQALVAELREMQERVLNPQLYDGPGRAYILSGLSSHSWQRATARGDSTELTGLVHRYQAPSMVDMLSRSQALQPEVPEALSRSPSISSSRSPAPTPAPTSGSPRPRRGLRSFRLRS